VKVPVWLLEVDGVINTYGTQKSPPTQVWPAADWIITKVGRFNIWAARPVVDFIRGVHERGEAEIRWHTSWQDGALDLAVGLGLPEFEVQEAPEWGSYDENAQGWWKLPPVHRVLAEGRSVLWTDDDAVCLSTRERAELQGSGLIEIIAPTYNTGLCKRHLRQIGEILPRLWR